MPTVIKKNPVWFLKELRQHYEDVWKLPESEFLKEPDFLVVDPKSGKKASVSFVVLDDGKTVGVVYDELS